MKDMLSTWKPLPRALLAQVAALLLLTLLLPALPNLPDTAQQATQGGLAALLGQLLGLPWWWLPINFLLPLAVSGLLLLELPPWIYLVAFAILALIYWNSAGERVPLYLSNRSTWQALEQLLAKQPTNVQFVDLGSGLGGTLFYLAKRYPQAQFVGVESAPLPFALAWLRARLHGLDNLQLRYGSLWDHPLGDYQWVYAFLSPQPMPRLYRKWQQEARPDSRLISNSFAVPDASPQCILKLHDRRQTQLYVYTMNGHPPEAKKAVIHSPATCV